MMTWSELLHRLVLVQRTSRLCAARDLDELDVVGRVMRKDNYLIGMLNAGEANKVTQWHRSLKSDAKLHTG
jgi:autophagy-related protein 9